MMNTSCTKKKRMEFSMEDFGFSGGSNLQIKGLAVESGKVREGYLFAALAGTNTHGANYIPQALARGALAVLTDTEGKRIAQSKGVEGLDNLFVDPDPRSRLAKVSAKFFGNIPENLVAVTGTNGKTSVASMCRQIWEELGHPAVNIGTIGIEGAYSAAIKHTTPDPITLHLHLSRISRENIKHASLEASSHGLRQRRLDGLEFKAAAFTNLTREHLDYHSSMEDYFASKASLFKRNLEPDGCAVICIDSDWGKQLHSITEKKKIRTITVGQEPSDLKLIQQRYMKTGQEILFEWQGRKYETHFPLIGEFQALNALTAAGLIIGSGTKPDEVFNVLEKLIPVPGRMENVAKKANGGIVFVDYSHTPDALELALKSLKHHFMGKIRVVFGAGGDRDKGKRMMMGTAAKSNADMVYVTDVNPRTENPAQIRKEILMGCPQALEIGDRSLAIMQAVHDLDTGEALLIAGKGHEQIQIIGTTEIPFSDSEQASIAARVSDGKNPG